MPIDNLWWMPIAAFTLPLSAAALLAKARYKWYNRELTFFSKISFTVFVIACLALIVYAEWYLYHGIVRALESIL